MRISKVTIEGFRSFGDRQTIEFDDLTAFIGENGSGKTAALSAIGKLFAQRQADRQLTRSDFHLPKDVKPEDIDELRLMIEAVLVFDELESANSDDIAAIFLDYMTVDGQAETPMARIRLSATWSRSANVEGSIDSKVVFVTTGEGKPEDEENIILAKRQVLDAIRMIYVPATRNPKAELRLTSGSVMSGLMGSVSWSESRRSAIEKKIDEICGAVLMEPGAAAIGASLHEAWNDLDSDDRYRNAKLTFGGGSFESVVNHPAVVFSPTPVERAYEVEELGDGLRSLFYFSMVKSLIELEDKIRSKTDGVDEHFDTVLPALTILAVEEPENHIAPHLLGKLLTELEAIGEKRHCQVIATSHSPAIAGRVEPRGIRHFKMHRETRSTVCRRLILPPDNNAEVYKYVRSSLLAYPEVLFAKAVVLGEGSSEEIVLPRAIEALCGQADAIGVSVAPLGGRHVNHFWRLLNELEIPYVTLLDLDRERAGGGWGRIKYAASKVEEFGLSENVDWPGKITAVSDAFKKLNERAEDDPELAKWINCLEMMDVFFASPLDLDFALLCSFPDAYKAIAEENETLSGNDKQARANCRRSIESRQHDIRYVLHSGRYGSGGDGSTYTEEQKDLMPYYRRLFLGRRGKPSTHLLALSDIDDETFTEQMPEVLKRLVRRVSSLVSQPYEEAINET